MQTATTKPARVLLADPAWHFGDKLPGPKRGAESHYGTMSTRDISLMPLPRIADDAWLFLWRVHTHQLDAHAVMRAWGFQYVSEIVWVKTTKAGKPRMGMGRTIRQCHEVCLVGRRGKPTQLSKACGSVINAPRREHSRKPDELYGLIEAFAPGPYVELFARHRREGWVSFGDELPELADAAE